MLTVYDSKGTSYTLHEQIGRGGEGTVFVCPDDKTLVAKIYHEPVAPDKAEKLRWMAVNKSERLLKVAAWIVDTLHDRPQAEEEAKIVGFLMPNVRAKEIHELYSLKSRRVYFPDATWQFLVHTAANVARAFYNLHRDGHVMGDVNHGNCVVLADGTVKLIDCDSYSIKKDDARYPCEVGVATHLAPELQGKNLRDVEREEKHDNFGLAVIVFQLLFLGRHPHAGIYLGEEDKSIEECIREYRFAYGRDARAKSVRQPPGTLALAHVSPRIAEMFERAFLEENRPTAQEWIEALEDLSHNLNQCAAHPGHFYFQKLTNCPWCAIEAQTGLMLFPFTTGNRAAGEEAFNIFTVENLLANLNVPQTSLALVAKPPREVVVSPESREVKSDINAHLAMLVGGQFLVTLLIVVVIGSYTILIPSLIIFAICLGIFHNVDKNLKIDLGIRYDTAEREWERLEQEWQKVSTNALNENLSDIRDKIEAYHNLPNQSRKRIKYLMDEEFEQRLTKYLDSFSIEEAPISGIGIGKFTALKNFGINTAAEIKGKQLNLVPGIGRTTVRNLIQWRQTLERNFPHQPDISVAPNVRQKIETEISALRKKFEREINAMLVPLHSKTAQMRQQQMQLTTKSTDIAGKVAQTKIDYESLSFKIPPALVMGFVAVAMVVLGNVVHYKPNVKPYSGAFSEKPASLPAISKPAGSGTGSGTATSYSPDYKVAENLTDEQIAAMTDWERKSGAKTLDKEATQLTYVKKDYAAAEKKLRLAVRLDSQDVNILNQLSYVLYERKQFKESLETLNQAKKLNSIDTLTDIYIGMNYLELKRFGDAKAVFIKVADTTKSFEVYYNLGLAHKGLAEYNAAATAFQKSIDVSISPDKSDAQVELIVCLSRAGRKTEAAGALEELRKTDKSRAYETEKLVKKLPPAKPESMQVELTTN